jgi:hypothetical protein
MIKNQYFELGYIYFHFENVLKAKKQVKTSKNPFQIENFLGGDPCNSRQKSGCQTFKPKLR